MSIFKDIINQDLDMVFFNPDEFGEYHRINSKRLLIVKDDDRLLERQNKEFDGISIGEILYFVKANDFGELPEVGTPQKFDGRPMFVTSVREDNGIYEIILQQNRGE